MKTGCPALFSNALLVAVALAAVHLAGLAAVHAADEPSAQWAGSYEVSLPCYGTTCCCFAPVDNAPDVIVTQSSTEVVFSGLVSGSPGCLVSGRRQVTVPISSSGLTTPRFPSAMTLPDLNSSRLFLSTYNPEGTVYVTLPSGLCSARWTRQASAAGGLTSAMLYI